MEAAKTQGFEPIKLKGPYRHTVCTANFRESAYPTIFTQRFFESAYSRTLLFSADQLLMDSLGGETQ